MESQIAEYKNLVSIAGTGYCGTSVVTHLFKALGFNLGTKFKVKPLSSPKRDGQFENMEVAGINMELTKHGDTEDNKELVGEFCRKFDGNLFKVCTTMYNIDLWNNMANKPIHWIFVLRNPWSIMKRFSTFWGDARAYKETHDGYIEMLKALDSDADISIMNYDSFDETLECQLCKIIRNLGMEPDTVYIRRMIDGVYSKGRNSFPDFQKEMLKVPIDIMILYNMILGRTVSIC